MFIKRLLGYAFLEETPSAAHWDKLRINLSNWEDLSPVWPFRSPVLHPLLLGLCPSILLLAVLFFSFLPLFLALWSSPILYIIRPKYYNLNLVICILIDFWISSKIHGLLVFCLFVCFNFLWSSLLKFRNVKCQYLFILLLWSPHFISIKYDRENHWLHDSYLCRYRHISFPRMKIVWPFVHFHTSHTMP